MSSSTPLREKGVESETRLCIIGTSVVHMQAVLAHSLNALALIVSKKKLTRKHSPRACLVVAARPAGSTVNFKGSFKIQRKVADGFDNPNQVAFGNSLSRFGRTQAHEQAPAS